MDPSEQAKVNEALDRMWVQFLPLMRERVATLQAPAAAFSQDRLSLEQHIAANEAAHKLAGVLGTFNLTRGTVLARELEIMYSRDGGPDPALAERLAEIVAELHGIVENRQ